MTNTLAEQRQSDIETLGRVKIVEGGKGLYVSNEVSRYWSLAGKGDTTGTWSGTVLGHVVAEQLTMGDAEVGEALDLFAEDFPVAARAIRKRWWNRVERLNTLGVPLYSQNPHPILQWLNIFAAYTEVYRFAKVSPYPMGMNLLGKCEEPQPALVFGYEWGVYRFRPRRSLNVIFAGAGLPVHLTPLAHDLAREKRATLGISGASGATFPMTLDLSKLTEDESATTQRMLRTAPLIPPMVIPLVTTQRAVRFYQRLNRNAPEPCYGVVIKNIVSAGHHANPADDTYDVDQSGRRISVYGPSDEMDYEWLNGTGLPYWIGGDMAYQDSLASAQKLGARGTMIGTLLSVTEGGFPEEKRRTIIDAALKGELTVSILRDFSSSGYSFAVAHLLDTMWNPDVARTFKRACTMGYLRTLYENDDGTVGYRCGAEPRADFIRKGGVYELDAEGNELIPQCLCRTLWSAVKKKKVDDLQSSDPHTITQSPGIDGKGAERQIQTLVRATGAGYPDGPPITAEVVYRYLIGRAT